MGNRSVVTAVTACVAVHVAALVAALAVVPNSWGCDVMEMRNGPDIALGPCADVALPAAGLGLLAAADVAAGLLTTHWARRRGTLWVAAAAAGVVSFALTAMTLGAAEGRMSRSWFLGVGWTTAGTVALVVLLTELFLAGILRVPFADGGGPIPDRHA